MAQTTWYPTRCPAWCAGQHAAILALDDPGDMLEAAEIVTHAADLARGAGLVVSLGRDEAHPHSTQPATDTRVFVWLPDRHELDGTTPALLRVWADTLTIAAAAAESLTGSNPQ